MAKGKGEVLFDGLKPQATFPLPITEMEKKFFRVVVATAKKVDDVLFGKAEEVIYRQITGEDK